MPTLDPLESYSVVPYGQELYYPSHAPARILFLAHHDPAQQPIPGAPTYSELSSLYLHQLALRLQLRSWHSHSPDDELRHYAVPVAEAFQTASNEYPSISVDSQVMAGAPCVEGTRIPVYMILDAIEHYGNVEEALRSYPTITLQQVKDAIGFAKLVVECPIEDRASSPS